MEILHLTLTKRWFDMIASGYKKEEYREYKPYWIKRLFKNVEAQEFQAKKFEYIQFRNGYAKNAPTMIVEFKGTTIGHPSYKWYGCHDGKPVFVISLGKVISFKNYEPPKEHNECHGKGDVVSYKLQCSGCNQLFYSISDMYKVEHKCIHNDGKY